MGECVSVPDRCLGNSHSNKNIDTKSKKKTKRNINNANVSIRSFEKRVVDETVSPDRTSYLTARASVDEEWFDTTLAFESDCEEDFLSVQDDALSLNGHEGAFVSHIDSPKGINNEESPSLTNLSSKIPLQRPIAGCQVPFCPLDKKVLDSWSQIGPTTFRVRAQNYLRDKKKEPASNYAAYYPFGVDVFLSPKKLSHIARFVELPIADVLGDFPTFLVVNAQIPTYPPSLFHNEPDGEGFNIVLYFKLSANYLKELPLQFQENFKKFLDDEKEQIKGFASDTVVPFRERLKILGSVVNVDELPINAAERKIMHTYNGKPLLTRPQHEFFLGKDYFEIDLDMHRFSYISRKGFDTFLDKLKLCVLDFGLTIQGNKTEELPEQVLCCIRLNGIDYMNYQHLGSSEETLDL